MAILVRLLLTAALLLLPLALSLPTTVAPHSTNTNGSDGATPDLRLLLEDVDAGKQMESETSKRLMMMQPIKRYISYETLRRDMVPCTNPGASYYNCEAGRSRANPYTRGCEVITGCARIIKDDLSGAGTAVLIKNAVLPRLKSWIRKIVSEEDNAEKTSSRPNSAEEAAAAAKAAAAAAAEVARASQEMLTFKVEEKKYFGNLANLLDVQLREIKSMNNAILKLEGNANTSSAISAFHQEDSRDWMTSSRATYPNGKADYNSRSVRPTSPPMSRQPSGPPHPESYLEIMAMVQRGERPPNVRDIDDSPPDPNCPISNSRVTPRAKPWEAGQSQNNKGFAHQSSSNEGGLNYYGAENGVGSRTNGGGSGPWGQKKNVRITELDQDNELKTGTYGSQFSEQPARSTWVPPQPPPIAMPEAAEAIRRPKPTAQKELNDDQLMGHSSEVSEELQKATKFSEAGGAVDTNSLEMRTNSSNEIQEEQGHS